MQNELFYSSYNFSQKNDILATDDEDTTGNITVGIADVYPFNGVLEYQVGYGNDKISVLASSH